MPGSLLWGPKYVRPSATAAGWTSFSVAWTLPAGNNRFAAAVEQVYNYPNCDPHAVDDNRTFLGHAWTYYRGSWGPYRNSTGYYNLMIRVRVSNDTSSVTPTSLGRLRALYY